MMPTVLNNCSHSFCKGCRESYLENHLKDEAPCPACKVKEIQPEQIDGLVTNFDSALDMQESVPESNEKKSKCPDHPSKVYTFICIDCMCYVCNSCILTGVHKEHSLEAVEDADEDFAKKSAEIGDILKSLEAKVEEAHRQADSQITTAAESLNKEINRRTKEVIEAAEKWRAEMLGRLDNEVNVISANIREQPTCEVPNITISGDVQVEIGELHHNGNYMAVVYHLLALLLMLLTSVYKLSNIFRVWLW